MVEDEDGSSSKPLTIDLAPGSLAPASVCDSQMQGTFMQVMPEYTRCQMSHGIEIVMSHHLRLTTGAAGEVHQHGVVIVVDKGGSDEFRCLSPFFLPVMESFGDGLTMIRDGDILFDRRALIFCSLYLTHYISIVHTDNRLDGGTGVAVDDVMFRQHVGGWNRNSPNLTQCEHHYPPLIAAFQNQHDRIVLANT